MESPCVCGNLVLNEDRLAGNQSGTVDLVHGLANNLQLGAEGRSDLTLISAGVTEFRSQLHSQIVVLVTCVTDKDTRKNFLDVFLAGVRLLLQQPGQDQGGGSGIVGTGNDAGGDHGLLDIVQFSTLQQAFCGADLCALCLVQQDEIGVLQLVIENNGVGACKALGIVTVTDGQITGAVQDIS